MDTPEFLSWALEYTCPIRGFQDGSDPERAERQLRAARAVSEARREGRIMDGLCVEPPYGFRIEDALAIYGGMPAVERECRGCGANAISRLDPSALAGCYGLVPLPGDARDVFRTVDLAIVEQRLAEEFQHHFTATQPAWYGLWMHSPLSRQQAALLLELLRAGDFSGRFGREFSELQGGLESSVEHNLRLHVAIYPAGRVEGTWWQLAPHCPRCKGPWHKSASRRCDICGYLGAPAPDKKRHARGRRPYFPLDRLLGSAAAAELLVRYAAGQAQRPLPDRELNPRLAARPNSPPAD